MKPSLKIAVITLFFIYFCFVSQQSVADSTGPAKPVLKTDLLPPAFLNLYKKPADSLSYLQKWNIMIHGLRMAALDPLVWGIRRSQRTENRRLVPIRPLYLRMSEQKDFIFEELNVIFIFRAVNKDAAIKNYHTKDSVFDIGFAGEYKAGTAIEPPKRDTSYVVRLSAFDDFPSGIFYRSQDMHILLEKPTNPILKTAEEYHLKLLFSDNGVQAYLNDEHFAALEQKGINSGLLYMLTSWNPLRIDSLSITGHHKGSRDEKILLSGLISENRKEE